jgi:predicted amidohydrolase YtcJ
MEDMALLNLAIATLTLDQKNIIFSLVILLSGWVCHDRIMKTLICLLLTTGAVSAQVADTIYHNGKCVTVDGKFRIVSALAVKDDRIMAVDEFAKLKPVTGPNTKLVDLNDRTVIPGLIDNHLHFLRDALRWKQQTRIDGITSRAKALEVIAAKAKASPAGQWVFVLGGWSEDQFADQSGGFTKEELDSAAPANPVMIQKSYMAAYTNSLAEQALGGSSSQGGGRMRKSKGKGGSGGDSGARGVINSALDRFLPEPAETEALQNIRDFSHVLNALGLTTVYDVGRDSDGPIGLCAQLAASKQATLRIFHTLRYSANDPSEADAAVSLIQRSKPRQNDVWAGLIGIGEHTYGPIHDSTMRFTRYSAEELAPFERIAAAAALGGWHIHDHAMQDSTINAYMDIFERVAQKGSIARWTLAHCDLISPQSIARAKQLGLTLAIHNKTAKPAGRDGDSPPLKAIQDSGIVWGLGSDGGVVAPINPFSTLWWAVTGRIFPDRVAIEQPVTREQALIAHTRSNAYLLFKEQDIGSLEVGKLADFLVLDRDYLTVPAQEIKDIRPLLTVIGGKVVYGKGR